MESASRLSESNPRNLAPNIVSPTLLQMDIQDLISPLKNTTTPASSLSKTPAVDVPSQPAKKKRVRKKNCQPTAAQLALLGIKVRDFAYEDTGLPPVRPYRVPIQIQPSVNRRPLQREITEPADEGVFSQPSQDTNRQLERTITEPVLTLPPPTRQPRFLNLEDLLRTDQRRTVLSLPAPARPVEVLPPIASSPLELDSSDIKTPVVTPNGSLVWQPQENEATLTTLPGSLRRTSSQPSVSADMPQMVNATLSFPQLSTSPFHQPLSRSNTSQRSSALVHKHSSLLIGTKVSHSKKSQDKATTHGHYNLRKRKSYLDFSKQDSTKRIKYTPDSSPSRARATSSGLSRSPIQHKQVKPN